MSGRLYIADAICILGFARAASSVAKTTKTGTTTTA
jgi:hypothetical protein